MDFTRLRLSGFKSFVEPSEFRIEPGLTGVVGPNGCGKSNLLEAMRWVMGAASAKAMRGEGMDDVIFAGSGARPSRNHAEVTLTIDNAARDAPAALNGEAVLEVTRRIDRGEGSTYKVNGREVRARDVQILFADARAGANSPALVRQGQISELIAAKPQNRRRILEEAAGVTGLYGRRHEAELRVAAAQVNLERLDDLARELESGLSRLRREARQASRYKALAAEIRALHATLLQQKWAEARGLAERAASEAARAAGELEAAVRAAAAASAQAAGAETAIRPLRDEEAAASAVLGRLAIEKDRLDRDLELAQAESRRLAADLERIAADDAREAERAADAAAATARLEAEILELRGELEAAPERTPALEAAARRAEVARAEADGEVEALAAAAAAGEAEDRAARARLAEAEARLARVDAALAQARAELASMGGAPSAGEAGPGMKRAVEALATARQALESAEAARAQAQVAESGARQAARAAEDELAGAAAEAAALARLAGTPADKAFTAVLDLVAPHPGLEAALAAALGDDLVAALDKRSPAYWAGAEAKAPAWPKGASPLADQVKAPAQLAARLAFTALVNAADGERLQGALPPGARLVSREGDLWRWDGYTQRAAAPRPAQARLEQKARLAALRTAIAELEPAAKTARGAHARAGGEVTAAEAALRAARTAAALAEAALAKAREAADRQAREAAKREARAGLLTETARRLEGDADEARGTLAQLRVATSPIDAALPARLEAARAAAVVAREVAARARAALDAETRERDGRARRHTVLIAERADWDHRGESAKARREALAKERASVETQLTLAREAPAKARGTLARLLDDLGAAQTRKTKAADALALAETARADADRAARAAEGRAADAREARAGLAARLDGARERLAEQAAALAEASGLAPGELDQHFGAQAAANDPHPGASEARLASLERERDTMGPVNLRAEDEAAEQGARLAALAAERADLAGALARLRQAIGELNAEGRTRLLAAFEIIQGHFRDLFVTLFQGGQAELRLVESDDPLEAGLEVLACPPGKRMAVMSLMSGGEQALTAMALIFAVFLSAPAPVCVLDEADAPLDDANVERFCNLLAAMRARAATRFIVITHNPLTMSRMDRLYGVTMREAGISQLVSVDLRQAEAIAAQ
jgi:chromosome segregation protein